MTEHAHTLINELIDAARNTDDVRLEYVEIEWYVSKLEHAVKVLQAECQTIMTAERIKFDDTEEFFHWARNRAKDALEKTYYLNGTI